jgi:tetratricopeptide (TPR) repeat protein
MKATLVRTIPAVICWIIPCVAVQGADVCDAASKAYLEGAYADAAASYETCHAQALTPVARTAAATQLGIALHRLGREEEAGPWLHRALDAWPSIPGGADNMARTALWLVETERVLGHFAAVEPILRSALQAHPQPLLTAELRSRLAVILCETGRPQESRTELQAVLAAPGITVDQQIEALMAKATLDRHVMRFSESLDSLNRALPLAYGEGSTRAQSDVLQALGLTWMGMGDLSRAESALNRALILTETGEGSTPQRIATALQCLAAVHARNHKYALAEDELLRSLAGLRRTLREGHPQIASAIGDLAEVYRLEQNLTVARQYADEAHSAMLRSMGPDSLGAAEMLGLLARIEAQANNLPDAAEHYSVAIAALRKQGADRDVRMAELMDGYASVLASLHRGNEARQVRTELHALLPGKP